jgi:hypothetical protein
MPQEIRPETPKAFHNHGGPLSDLRPILMSSIREGGPVQGVLDTAVEQAEREKRRARTCHEQDEGILKLTA